MKKFISVSLILVGIALIATVIVWYLLQGLFIKSDSAKDNTSQSGIGSLIQDKFSRGSNTASDGSKDEANAEPIKIGDFTITKEQQEAAENLGLDLTAIKLTDEAIDCAKDTLSPQRLDEILSGDAPTFLETMSLLPCLKN